MQSQWRLGKDRGGKATHTRRTEHLKMIKTKL